MTNSLNHAQAALQVLQQAYVQQLPEKLAKIQAAWERVLSICQAEAEALGLVVFPHLEGLPAESHGEVDSPIVFTQFQDGSWSQGWVQESLMTLHQLVHNLSGSGATFGLLSLSEVSRTLELFLQSILASNHAPTQEQQTQISALLDSLHQLALEHQQGASLGHAPESHGLVGKRSPNFLDERLIFIVEADAHQAETLSLQVGCFGYTVRVFQQVEGLREAIHQGHPAAIIVDLAFANNYLIQTITAIQSTCALPIPIIFISVRDDLAARLQAVRAKGNAYFTKPVDIGQLIDKLDHLVGHQLPEPYRIVIVEDDPTLAAYYELVLRQMGMRTVVVTDPMQVMQPLIEFKPDLILMDVYMPGCTGLELAMMIRQQEAFLSIPITFLSSETDLEKQMVAMSLGGDDFLTKPIQPDHLVAAVTTRVQRSRALRSLMVRDSLTGLLNHTNVKEQLYLEVRRASRQNRTLSFAMIDIDHFKRVNDQYGHLAGDRIIKSLARLLRQRLRRTDVLGRYGGEEFAVILLDTDSTNAVRILDQIRSDFAQVRQQFGRDEFTITFSCGIASFPHYQDAAEINDAADKALYEAKRRGRNCTILSTQEARATETFVDY